MREIIFYIAAVFVAFMIGLKCEDYWRDQEDSKRNKRMEESAKLSVDSPGQSKATTRSYTAFQYRFIETSFDKCTGFSIESDISATARKKLENDPTLVALGKALCLMTSCKVCIPVKTVPLVKYDGH